MGLTTHVLDTALGKPAEGLRVVLYRLDPNPAKVTQAVTNADGRCDAPLIADGELAPGRYELVFQTGAYFDTQDIDLPEPKFLDEIPIRFGIADGTTHYHVPLLLSPFGYSTYRGS